MCHDDEPGMYFERCFYTLYIFNVLSDVSGCALPLLLFSEHELSTTE